MSHASQSTSSLPIAVVYAGGTISSFVHPQGYRQGGKKIDLIAQLRQRISHQLPPITLIHSEFAYLGLSENIHYAALDKIEKSILTALTKSPRVILVTYGTDSMEHAARYFQQRLGETLAAKQTAIILTGANRDTSHPQTDAWENLIFTLECAGKTLNPEVYVAFHQLLIPANQVAKEPFNENEMKYISIHSDRYQSLQAQHQRQEQVLLQKIAKRPEVPAPEAVIDYPVNRILVNHQELFSQLHPGSKAILLTLYHSGTANTLDRYTSVARLVRKLRREENLVFFGVSENGEPIDLRLYSTSVALRKAGVVPLYNMSKEVALYKLQRVATLKPPEMIRAMLSNWVGEITTKIVEEDIKKLIRLYTRS